jgi:hypothetical protein
MVSRYLCHNIFLRCSLIIPADILVLDKIDSGMLNLSKQIIGAEKFLMESVLVLKPMAREKDINLNLIIHDSIRSHPFIEVDVFKMRQVLRNVISNSIKFTPTGGMVEIRLGVYPSPLAVSAVVPDVLRFEIVDSGVGMDDESKNKIFDSVFQFRPEILQGGGGSGLGLYISKRIVAAHNGSIAMLSEGSNRGCIFTIEIPSIDDPIDLNLEGALPESRAPANNIGLIQSRVRMNQTQVHPLPQTVELTTSSKRHAESFESALNKNVQIAFAKPGLSKILRFLVTDDSMACRKMQVWYLLPLVFTFRSIIYLACAG